MGVEPELRMVITTSDDRTELDTISRELVREGLAACCQIDGPITSVYLWNDELETSSEWRCLIKTTRFNVQPVFEFVRQRHHYAVPQLIAFAASEVDDAYGRWVLESVSPDPS